MPQHSKWQRGPSSQVGTQHIYIFLTKYIYIAYWQANMLNSSMSYDNPLFSSAHRPAIRPKTSGRSYRSCVSYRWYHLPQRRRSHMAETNLSQEQQDEALLQKFGYKQELRRTLGFLSNFAVAFSYISVSTGTFSLFFLGLVAGGPAFFWTWPIVAIGQFIVALNFAELSSHFPIAGSIYQWSKRLSGHSLGWFTGWFYFFAGALTVTGVAITIPIPLLAIFPGIPATILGMPSNVFIALVAIIVGTIINVMGVRLVSIINNIGVVAEIIGMFGFALVLLIFFNHQPLSFLFTGSSISASSLSHSLGVPGAQWTPGLGDTYIG